MRRVLIVSAALHVMACTTTSSNDGYLPSAVDGPSADGEATDADTGSSAAGHDGGGGATPSTPAGSSSAPPSPSSSSSAGTTDPFALARKACVDAVNKYRAMKGLTALTRYAAKEPCADTQAGVDAAHPTQPHYAYLNGAPSCIENNVLDRQNECPGWYGPPEKAAADCVTKMYAEGPGTGPAHGHYNVLVNPQYTRLSCGFHVKAGAPPGSAVWLVLNFY